MNEQNPWTEQFWNITRQGEFFTKHGLTKTREAIIEAGLNPDRLGFKEEAPEPTAPPSLLAAFSKENAEKFEQTVKNHKPGASSAATDYSGYMRRKRAQRP